MGAWGTAIAERCAQVMATRRAPRAPSAKEMDTQQENVATMIRRKGQAKEAKAAKAKASRGNKGKRKGRRGKLSEHFYGKGSGHCQKQYSLDTWEPPADGT